MWKFIKKYGTWAWKMVAIFGVLFGIWVGWHGIFSAPSILAQIVTETNVLDVHESLENLQILFQGNDIQANRLNLKIYHIRFQNNGDTNITQNDFDTNEGWGVKIDSGRIVDARLIDSSSGYVGENLSPMVNSTTTVAFKEILLDKGDAFTIELLVLHDKDTLPKLYRTGKIAGIKDNESEIFPMEQKESFSKALVFGSLYGGLWVSAARFVAYFFVSVVLFMAVIVLIVKLQEKRKRALQAPQPQQQPRG